MSQAVNAIAVELTTRDAQDLANDPGVLSVEVDAKVSIYSGAEQVNAPWGLDRVDQRSLPLSTTYQGGGEGCGVIVYVVDTGLRATHEEFAGRVASGYDAVDDDFNPDDCQGHGTHVAGTAVGTKYGVAKEATVVGVRVLNCWGSGSMSDVVAGLDWVRTNHSLNFPTRPAVVNMSLGGGGNNTLDAAVNNLVASGISVVVAAGNSNDDAKYYSPARAGNAITVASAASNDYRSGFSNWGTVVDIFAPGSSIESAAIMCDTCSTTMSGTSMASPHVAGAAAIYLGANGSATPAQVESSLVQLSTKSIVCSPGASTTAHLLYIGALSNLSLIHI